MPHLEFPAQDMQMLQPKQNNRILTENEYSFTVLQIEQNQPEHKDLLSQFTC